VLRSEHSGYKSRIKQPYPVLGPYLKIIDKWLDDDRQRPKKQRHTAVRVYNRLKQEHFTGAATTENRYVREAKLRLGINIHQAFIPLQPEPGGEAGVDWGTCTAILGGKATRLKFFCIRSKYSGKHFVRCYPCDSLSEGTKYPSQISAISQKILAPQCIRCFEYSYRSYLWCLTLQIT